MSDGDTGRPTGVDADAPGRVRPWGSLAFPQYRMLLGTFAFSAAGMQMRQVVNLYVLYQLSGSAFQVGLLGLFQFAPLLVLGFVGGSFADTFDRKKLLLIAQVGNLSMAVMLAALALLNMLQVWHIYLATFVTAGSSAFDQPARMGLIYAVVPRSHMMNAVTLNSTARHATALFGPALAGVLLAWQGPTGAYIAIAALLFPVSFIIVLMRLPSAPPRRARNAMSLGEMLAGFKFFFSTQIILALVVMDMVATIFGAHRVVMPIFADDILGVGERGFGLLMSAPAFGFLVGSAILLALGDVRRKGVLALGAFVGYALAIALFATSRSFPLSLFAIALVGGLDGIGAITRQTTLQMMVPEEIRGRATAALQMFNRGAPSMGYMVTGALAVGLGAPGALLAGSVVSLSVALLLFIAWRQVTTFRM